MVAKMKKIAKDISSRIHVFHLRWVSTGDNWSSDRRIGKVLKMRLPSQFAATMLGLGMLSAGALGASAQSTPMFTTGLHASTITQQAPLKTMQAASGQDPRCAADQANGAAENNGSAETKSETSGTENSADTDNLQCGDQVQETGTNSAVTQQAPVTSVNVSGKVTLLRAPGSQPAAATQSSASEQESAAETSATTETDGIVCDQQGQNQGDNTGC